MIEGNKGLHDGTAQDGSNSNAALAVLLGAPVVLVLDTRGTTRGIAPLILGFQAFDPAVKLAGVILNQVGGSRHESKLRDAVEYHTDLPVLGAVYRNAELEISERHLGLVPSNEAGPAQVTVARISRLVAQQVDLDGLLRLATPAEAPALQRAEPSTLLPVPDVRIGIARDSAFGFYYADDLDALRGAGAELVPFDTLRDSRLPEVDAVFIGGGFPETQMEALEANTSLRRALREAIEGGLPAYAECGGLMYLARRIRWGERSSEMVGVLPADVVMHSRPQGRGYVRLAETGRGPWPLLDGAGAPAEVAAHEFHYSRLENLSGEVEFAYRVLRGTGADGRHDGIVYKNVLASYVHLRSVTSNPWAERFVNFVRDKRKARRRVA